MPTLKYFDKCVRITDHTGRGLTFQKGLLAFEITGEMVRIWEERNPAKDVLYAPAATITNGNTAALFADAAAVDTYLQENFFFELGTGDGAAPVSGSAFIYHEVSGSDKAYIGPLDILKLVTLRNFYVGGSEAEDGGAWYHRITHDKVNGVAFITGGPGFLTGNIITVLGTYD